MKEEIKRREKEKERRKGRETRQNLEVRREEISSGGRNVTGVCD